MWHEFMCPLSYGFVQRRDFTICLFHAFMQTIWYQCNYVFMTILLLTLSHCKVNQKKNRFSFSIFVSNISKWLCHSFVFAHQLSDHRSYHVCIIIIEYKCAIILIISLTDHVVLIPIFSIIFLFVNRHTLDFAVWAYL